MNSGTDPTCKDLSQAQNGLIPHGILFLDGVPPFRMLEVHTPEVGFMGLHDLRIARPRWSEYPRYKASKASVGAVFVA